MPIIGPHIAVVKAVSYYILSGNDYFSVQVHSAVVMGLKFFDYNHAVLEAFSVLTAVDDVIILVRVGEEHYSVGINRLEPTSAVGPGEGITIRFIEIKGFTCNRVGLLCIEVQQRIIAIAITSHLGNSVIIRTVDRAEGVVKVYHSLALLVNHTALIGIIDDQDVILADRRSKPRPVGFTGDVLQVVSGKTDKTINLFRYRVDSGCVVIGVRLRAVVPNTYAHRAVQLGLEQDLIGVCGGGGQY